jgi:PKD repeat protein
MKKLFLFVGLIFIFVALASAQNVSKRSVNLAPTIVKSINAVSNDNPTTVSGVKRCGTMEHLEWMKQQDPTLEARMQAEEKRFNEYIETHRTELENSKAAYTMPVVFHCVYNGTSGKITQTQANEQIVQMNKDWAGTNGRPMESFASSLRVNTGITFCLATKDPSGNATTGINWKPTTVSSFSSNDGVKKTASGGAAAWDPTKYLNVWLCNLSGGLCGYAQFVTSGVNSTFGVVCHYQYFGLTGASAPYNGGGTVSHEFGHCFNLYHIWGDASGCSPDDGYADTPTQDVSTSGAHSGVLTDACQGSSPGIMYMNLMDYSDDIDYANFTPNQTTVIQAATLNYLTSVANYNTTACGGGAAPVAAFTASATNVTTGTTVTFTDQSTNSPTAWAWALTPTTGFTYTGSTSATSQNPKIIFNTVGTYTVALTATNATGNNTCTKTSYITVTTPSSAPVAAFTANATTVAVGANVTFTDQSTNTPTTWAWTFGDGGTSTAQNPTHAYSATGTYTVALTATNAIGSNTCTKTSYITVSSAVTVCDTVMPASFSNASCSLAVYVADVTPYDSGYICGQNAYLDKEKAQLFTGTAGGTISDVIIMFPVKGGTGATSVKIYSSNAGVPGTLLGTSATIDKSAIDTTSQGVNFNNKYHFSTPVSAASDYFVSLVLPTGFTNATNTLAIWSTTYTCATNVQYEMWSDNTWNSFSTVYTANIDMAIFPVVCSTTVGNNEEISLDKSISIYPNPSSNQFTIDFSGNQQTNVEVNVYNMVGSLIKSISKELADKMIIDISDQNSGVYIINIKTDQGMIIRKLSLMK